MDNQRPFTIKPYDTIWPDMYAHEAAMIAEVCRPWMAAIEHIGSTAVPGLGAKPTIDMMLGFPDEPAARSSIPALEAAGHTYREGFFFKLPGRFDLVFKDVQGERLFNVHLAQMDGVFWRRHLWFRDYLREHPEPAREYQRLKEDLARRLSPDVDAYATAKTAFIRAVEKQAGWVAES
jgi:GrpB-like predicted nucleotidyltransferase (UPF0157 family)